MRKNSKIKIMIIVLGVLFALSTISSFNISDDPEINDKGIEIRDEMNLKSPKKSGYWTLDFIHIDDNWTDALLEDWCNGDGSWGNPYVIENVTIDASSSPTGSGIFINNSKNEYFKIKNCTVYNAGSGIYDAGIRLEYTNNGTLTKNNCSDNHRSGISLFNNCDNITISGNTVKDNTIYGIYFYKVSNVKLSGNRMYGCGVGNFGSLVERASHTIYVNNTVNEKPLYYYVNEIGLKADNFTGAGQVILINCNDSVISNVNTSQGSLGIHLYRCDNNTISGTTANNNKQYGIYIENRCDNNTISGSITNKNALCGIYLRDICNDNNISGNTANNNTQYGIYLFNLCDNNNITDNTVNDNVIHGVYLYYKCNDNLIKNNTANDNWYGIYLDDACDDNLIKNNTINRNNLGILLYDKSNRNNVTENKLKENGLCIFEYECTDNLIENNDCSGSTKNAPILIDGTATGVGAHNWTWAASEWGFSGSGMEGNPYIIRDLNIDGFGLASCIEINNSDVYFKIQNCTVSNSGTLEYQAGIKLQNANNGTIVNNTCSNNGENGIQLYSSCKYNNISRNTVHDNPLHGIHLEENCNNNTISGNTANYNYLSGIRLDSDCDNNTILGNTANYNGWEGINLEYSDNNTISGNTANYNNYEGINLENSNNNTISGNNANGNYQSGIFLEDSHNTTISGNTANYNYWVGIYVAHSDYNTISGNSANNNLGETGIHLLQSDHNTISGNTANNNYWAGICLTQSDYNTISGNTANENMYGIELWYNSDNNTVTGNTLHYNVLRCIHESSDCIGNVFANNDCIDEDESDGGKDEEVNQALISIIMLTIIGGIIALGVAGVVILLKKRKMRKPK